LNEASAIVTEAFNVFHLGDLLNNYQFFKVAPITLFSQLTQEYQSLHHNYVGNCPLFDEYTQYFGVLRWLVITVMTFTSHISGNSQEQTQHPLYAIPTVATKV